MTPICLEDIVFIGMVTLAGGWQLARFAMKVGKSRMKHKINPPSVDGPPEFIRTYRAQVNSLEFFPMFLVSLWMSGLFFHQVPSAILGLLYIYSRELYFNGYIKDAADRRPGFKFGAQILKLMMILAIIGFMHLLLKQYAGINVYLQYIKPRLP